MLDCYLAWNIIPISVSMCVSCHVLNEMGTSVITEFSLVHTFKVEAPSNVSLIKRDTLFYFIFSLTPANQNNQNLWICLKTHSLCPDCAGQNSHPCDHIHFSLEGRVHQKEKEGSHTNSATSMLHINIGNRRNVNQSKLILVCGEYIQAWIKSAA